MRIYTRSGDKGLTSLVYGKRVPKNDLRVEAYGTCDEANSMIGLASSFLENVSWDEKDKFLEQMHRVQTILFHVGAELATPADKEVAWKLKKEHIDRKSTRLNSSHVKISYAVFCLKKKNAIERLLEMAATMHINERERLQLAH